MFTEYTGRKAAVKGCTNQMELEDLRTGTAVAVFDKLDGSTILVMVDETIEHPTQECFMLSVNQMRHHGIDVCDMQPKFATEGRKGLFRIKVNDHELPFELVNGLASLHFRKTTELNC